jgi:hypothetical protein
VNGCHSERCRETKILLTGAAHEYSCELQYLGDNFGILRFVIDKEYDVDGIRLRPNDITYALYWTDRPYTLYVWHLGGSGEIVYYFNIADRISLQPREFIWRDLAVDVVIDSASGTPRVLDEDELPGDLPPELHRYIQAAKAHLLADFPDVISEANALLKKYILM